MKTIIAGSRCFSSMKLVVDAVKASKFEMTEVVSGTARGIDTLGEYYAQSRNIPVKRYPADWAKHGKSAGYKRNQAMAKYADALIAIWDGESKGTKHMIDIAKEQDLEVYIYTPKL